MMRGDLHWVDFPGVGRRPGLIVTRDSAIPLLRSVLVVPGTRVIRGIPSEVVLEVNDGPPERFALSFDNLATVAKRAIGDRIATLSPEVMADVCEALRFTVTC